jgi:hypothetical protein
MRVATGKIYLQSYIPVTYPEFCFEGGFSPGIFFGGRVQQIQLRIEGSENGDLGAVSP